MIAALLPYLRELSPVWTAVSIVAAMTVWAGAKRHRWAASFTVLWLCLVYNSTVLSRSASAVRYQLWPLWSYAQWMQGNRVFLTYIVLNILMLLPVGISMSFLCNSRKKIVLYGFSFSCLIEVSQLLTGRGLFEIDDILHNTLGVGLGILVYSIGQRFYASLKACDQKTE